MNSATTKRYWKCLDDLPSNVQRLAAQAFGQWKTNPAHPGLHFNRSKDEMMCIRFASANIGALGLRKRDTIYWFWIGSHAQYDQVLKGL